MNQLCPECNSPVRGRTDKKFCSDLCRNSYNNRQNSDTTNYMRTVNNMLRKNRRILMELTKNGRKKTNVHREQLFERGFSFRHYTHTCTNQKGNLYFFCYEYGYLPLERDFYFIVKSKSKERNAEARFTKSLKGFNMNIRKSNETTATPKGLNIQSSELLH